jgi:NTE family protein
LSEANLHPDWVAGISIGAINAALIAGNAPEQRVDKLRTFWEAVSRPPLGVPYFASFKIGDERFRNLVNQTRGLAILLFGAPNFFTPRLPSPFLHSIISPADLSFYDVGPLKNILERLVDFDRINDGATRFSVGAVNIKTGNFVYFDNTTHQIGPAHVMASGSLPPGFPPTEVDGEFYWDGGLVSNTPLQWVVETEPRRDTLAFQVDLWSARGEIPCDLAHIDLRQKEIRFSSRTRAGTDHFRKMQALRRATAKLLAQLPAPLRQTPEAELLEREADEKVYNIIQMVYRAKKYEGASMDYEFSRRTMEEHWKAGYNDAVRTLRHPEVLQRPKSLDGVFTFDLAVDGRE